MDSITMQSMAKINLGLDVIRKREDGYHDLRMVMQTIRLSDHIFIKKERDSGIRFRTNLPFLPDNEKNIAYKAAQILMEEFQIDDGIFINLEKHIPVAAGMAGGSSNAAAVLVGMNRLFELGLTKRELMERGVRLGADVPYCIMRGTALAEGIGEILTPLPAPPLCYIVIVKPNFFVSTKFVYTNLKVEEIKEHPDIDGITASIRNQDLDGIVSRLGNVLEEITIPAYPQIQEIKEDLLRQGALGSLMSGSGPTVFGIFSSLEQAKAAAGAMHRSYPSAFIRHTGLFNMKKPLH